MGELLLDRFFPKTWPHRVGAKGDDFGLVYAVGSDGAPYTLLTDARYALLLNSAGLFPGVVIERGVFPWREGWPENWSEGVSIDETGNVRLTCDPRDLDWATDEPA